ncbi:MAG: hypothetical protein JXR25_16625 [Pontiellaceae bacterium]|nr:hypothetical protein [Pontiellaceae bacterium]MBN2786447.1 hypothetical protein [Pontiellaceae bacterium]
MRHLSIPWIVLMAGLCRGALAEAPHIGYSYPAGGQLGTTFEVEIGGQYLSGATNVFVSGSGVHAGVEKYSVKYGDQQIRQFFNRKRNLTGSLGDKTGGELEKTKEQIRRIDEQLKMADLPPGMDPLDPKAWQRYFKNRAKEQFNPQIAERLRLRISIDPNAEAGEREIRIFTPDGLSNPIFFETGVLPESTEAEPNDDHMDPALQTVEIPSVINGQIRPGDIDHFRFHAGKGAAIVVNVSARRITPYLADAVPGWFQAVAALYDEDGNEVAYDDDYKFNPDPVLFFKVPESGTYTLSIRDSIYRGREDFVYRIAVGELPFITAIFPLGGPQGKNVDINLSGWNLPLTHISGPLPDNDGTIRQLSVQKNGYRSNRIPFSIDRMNETVEQEPNDGPEQAQSAATPLIINGRIQHPGDRDMYRFKGNKGETVSIGITARRLNSPLDSCITLTGPGIESPIRNDDYMPKDSTHLHLGAGLVTHHADSYLLKELPETGIYFVEVGDTQSKGGPDFAYRLQITPARPDFSLRLEPSGLQLDPGGTAVFTVLATRNEGFSDAIAITATNLPSGFKISETFIPAGEDSVRFTITAPNNLEPDVLCPDITGTAVINGETVTHEALAVDDQMQAFLYRHLVPARELTLAAGTEPAPISFEARLPASGTIRLPLGKEIRIPLIGLVHTRQPGATVSLDTPPEGIKVVKGWIGRRQKTAPDTPKATGTLTIKAEAPLQPGDQICLIPLAIVKKGRDEFHYPAPVITVQITPASE